MDWESRLASRLDDIGDLVEIEELMALSRFVLRMTEYLKAKFGGDGEEC